MRNKKLINPIEFMPTRPDGTPIIHPVEFLNKTAQDEKSKKATIVPAVFMDEPKLRNAQVKELIVPARFMTPDEAKAQNEQLSTSVAAFKNSQKALASDSLVPSAVDAKQKYKEKDDLAAKSPYQLANELMNKVHFARVEEKLFMFDGVIYKRVSDSQLDRIVLKECRSEVKRDGRPSLIEAIRKFILKEPNLDAKFDDYSNLLAFKNGILDIYSNKFFPSTPSIFLTSHFDFDYDLSADKGCPVFEHFVRSVAGDDQLLYNRVWQAIGYFITLDMNGKVFLLLQGAPDSGKSQLGEFIGSLFNNEAIASLQLNKLGSRFGLSALIGKRLNISLDLSSATLNRNSISILKQLTGDEEVEVEVKYCDPTKMKNGCKLVFASNHKLKLSEADKAFKNRLLIIPFRHSVPKENQDKHLLEKFKQERMSIVLKALAFYKQLVAKNYVFDGDYDFVTSAGDGDFVSDHDVMKLFVEEACCFVDFSEGTFSSKLFSAYRDFCYINDFQGIYDISSFSRTFGEVCGEKVKGSKWRDASICQGSQRGFKGVVLKS